tara:strand:- start:1496 stop:4825 length:3330 start_codon:yes stop_codon:yes gene_type:complete
MAKQLLEINKFFNGTVTTPDSTDTPEESASYSLNIDAVIKDGSLQSIPQNRIKYIYDTSGTAGGLDVDIDKISLIRSDDKVDAVYWDDDSKRIHFISNIDKNATLGSADYVGQIATTTTKLDEYSDFKKDTSNTGVAVNNTVELKDVAMESHSKEIHMGLGMNESPKWIGYTNHKQFGTKLSDPIIENAEVRYPSSVPFLAKTVTVGGATYGISEGDSRIWKINTSTGAFISSSDEGTFQNLQSICSDGTNLYVLDRQTTSTYTGVIIKVATDALSTKVKIIGLPVTYPGPSGSQYSDIEYTSTGTKIWVAAHLDAGSTSDSSTSGDEYLWNFEIPASNSSTLASDDLDARMPRTSGGGNSTVGTWVSPSPGALTAVTSGHFSAVSNWIQETFPKSLIKFPSENGAIYWLCRYSDHSSSPIDGLWTMLWLNKSAQSASNSNTDWESQATKVADYTEIRTLCLNRIPYDHTNNNSVCLTKVDHPSLAGGPEANWSDLKGTATAPRTSVGITSCNLDNANKLFTSIGSTIQRYPTALDNTFTTLATNGPNTKDLGAKVETTYNVTPSGQAQRTGTSVNIGHYVSNDVYLLRQDTTAGLDKVADDFSGNAAQTFLTDHSAVTIAVAAASTNTGTLQANYEYFYKMSFLFDGYQESNLSTETFASTQGNDIKNKEVTLTIADTSQIPRRASDVLIYRAESPTSNATKPDSFYRLVKQIPLDTVWTTTTTSGVTSATLMHEDKGTKLQSYEANSELPETLTNTIPNYSLSAQINNYLFVGKCSHPSIDDASTHVFRSKVGKFDTFDWLLDFVKLPTVPTALMAFNGRIWAFDEANTYKIEPNNMFIEDIFEGVGCLNDDAIVSTDFGMFFADNKNIYHLTSGMAEPIGEAIVRGSDASGTGNDITAWQNRKSYHTRAVYDPTRRSVYFSFKGTDDKFYVWSWNIPRKRWDLFSFDHGTSSSPPSATTVMPKGVCSLDTGEIFWGSNDPATTIDGNGDSTTSASKPKLKHFLGHASSLRHWTWVSKNLTMGNDTQEKKIKDILSVSRVKLQKTTNGTFPAAGSQLANNAATERGTYRMTDINSNATSLRIRLDSQSSTDSCSAIGVLFRTKRSPR